ncbi:MAG TPA: FapA family protein [Polyangiaceae bacterium]|nr:FapA family protein [Polyangiaceae bacterium]
MASPRLSIRVAQDHMAAFVSVVAGSEPIDDLAARLADAGIVAGLDEALLARLLERVKEPAFERDEQQIACGVAATRGRAGRVELAFEQGLAPGLVSDDGHMNFFERGLLKVVRAEQVVARVFAPEAGQAGYSVTGEPLPALSGTSAKLQLGTGVTADADGVVRARSGGVVLYKPGESLDVVAEHVHLGAVDLRTGHLDMQGSLSVRGDVERLLRASATGDLEVLGSVSGGSLRAGGSIRVSGSVRGGDAARVVAAHDVTINSCEAADVSAGGVLRVQDAVNSQLSGQYVVVTGRLRGGAALAETSLIVKEAGTSSGVLTLLHAGEPLDIPDLEDVQRAVMMQKLRRMAERGGVRDAFGRRGSSRGKGGRLGRLNAQLSAEELQERAEHAQHRAELACTAVIEAGVLHPGVQLRIGGSSLQFEQVARGLRYSLSPETGQLVAERTVA